MLKHVGDKCCCAGECGGKCSCQNKQLEHTGELSLADLQIGDVATIIKIKPQLRNRKKVCRCRAGDRNGTGNGSQSTFRRTVARKNPGDQYGSSQRRCGMYCTEKKGLIHSYEE